MKSSTGVARWSIETDGTHTAISGKAEDGSLVMTATIDHVTDGGSDTMQATLKRPSFGRITFNQSGPVGMPEGDTTALGWLSRVADDVQSAAQAPTSSPASEPTGSAPAGCAHALEAQVISCAAAGGKAAADAQADAACYTASAQADHVCSP